MSEHVYVADIARHEGQTITLKGWLYGKRSSGKLHFLQVRDGTGTIQCVVSKADVTPEVFELSDAVTQESSLVVVGDVRADARSPIGYELGVETLDVLQLAPGYPIGPKEHGVAFLMDNRHLWLRSPRPHAILKVRGAVIKASRDYFDERGFTLIDAPIFTPAACEGTSTLFATDYFGETAFLTQSGQLYMEAAAMAFGRVYCFGPTFRAEKSKTRRHLTEFWMIEPEVAYADLDSVMDLAEDYVATLVGRAISECGRELETLGRDVAALEPAAEKPYPRISYDEAVENLKARDVAMTWGDDFGGDEETVLSELFDKPLLIHRYPTQVKAFYMKNDPERPELALCCDMLAPEGYGEIIGGGQREDDLARLEEKIGAHDLPKEAFDWYLDLRRYGSVPHGGCGLGIERTVGWLCGLRHIREAIPFPRLMGRITP